MRTRCVNSGLNLAAGSSRPAAGVVAGRINTQARHIALQIALLIPILAGLAGLLISFRMMRLPDPKQSGSGEQVVLG